tara:strand:- start:1467 stop:1757 length:291 start_codon:yes stop_codon:yes gene_type:complete
MENEKMEYVTVTLKVPKEASELIDAAVGLVAAIKLAADDGFGLDDIPDLTSAAINVVAQVGNYEEIREELRSDPEAAANLAALTGAKILKSLDLLA